MGPYTTRRRLIKVAQNLKAHGKRLDFENVIGAATDDILRDIKEYKREELISGFQKPQVEDLFRQKVFPLFQNRR
mgnify:FL=1